MEVSDLFSVKYCVTTDIHSFPTRRSSDLGCTSDLMRTIVTNDGSGPWLRYALRRSTRCRSFSDLLHGVPEPTWPRPGLDRKSTRLNSSHPSISYAAFCLKKTTTRLRCIIL